MIQMNVKVSYISKDSPLNGKVNLGDVILSIDDENLNGDTEKLSKTNRRINQKK